jgi:ribonuclease HI
MKNKVYAIRKGRNTGIYTTWAECEEQVKGFPGAEYKSFSSIEEASKYLKNEDTITEPDPIDENIIVVYVDGSFNVDTNECGYAAFLMHGTKKKIICGKFQMMDGGRNAEGEVKAAHEVLKYLQVKQYKNIIIYYDHDGIGNWANHEWKANKSYTQAYTNFVDTLRNDGYNIKFEHVYGHTGINGNEYVDKLAKFMCGNSLTKSEKDLMYSLKNVNGFPNIGE